MADRSKSDIALTAGVQGAEDVGKAADKDTRNALVAELRSVVKAALVAHVQSVTAEATS